LAIHGENFQPVGNHALERAQMTHTDSVVATVKTLKLSK
jgi:hypothetical protein